MRGVPTTRLALAWRIRLTPNEDILNILDHCKIPYSVNSKSHKSYRIFLNTTRGKCAQQMSYGFKHLVKLGVWKKKSKTQQVGDFSKIDPQLDDYQVQI